MSNNVNNAGVSAVSVSESARLAKKSATKQIRRTKTLRNIIMIVFCLASALPFYLMFVNGTRSSQEIQAGTSFWFGTNLLENLKSFNEAQSGVGITVWRSMLNSLIIAVPYTALSVYFSALTAYGIHVYHFKFNKIAWGFILAVMMVPTQVSAIGFYQFMLKLGLVDTYFPLIITGVITPVVVFFMKQYLEGSLSIEMIEAARIDGAGEFRIFNTIAVPLMKPAIATQAIFQFVACWNNLFMPTMLISSSSKKTLPMFVSMLNAESFKTDYGVVFLGVSITILPMLIIYILLSRFIVEGVALGGVKE